jgi:uncharacterized protein DUF4440
MTPVSESETPPDVRRELEAFEQRLASAWTSGKCDEWGALVSSDWSVIHITGETFTRAQALEMCRKAAAPIDTMNVDDVSVRAYGDAAVVTGRTTVTSGGQTIRLRFTDFFLRRAGRWQVVASHATAVSA